MSTFLKDTAGYLYGKWGERVSSLSLLFPSRRARLFFSEALSQIVTEPVWQPETASIDELMAQISGQRAGDQVRLITELYRVWTQFHNESFDSFYFWGGMLLADFDAVDKYLIDADMLWGNVRDLKILEADHSYLTPEQKELVGRFWASFGAREGFSGEQEQFLRIWTTLGPIYHAYRERLAAQGMAYTGMMHRTAVERIKKGEVPEELRQKNFAVIGFNALTECEKRLLDYLKAEAQVDFFWDYDDYYLRGTQHEAGLFMRANVQRYPSANAQQCNRFEQPKQIRVVSAPSETLQCKYVHDFLRGLDAPGKETAVVLCDEGLLETLLYSMPPEVGQINVTMGYPLRQTLVYSLVERLLELQKQRRGATFYHSDVLGLLRHPLIAGRADTSQLVRRIETQRLIYVPASLLESFGELFVPQEGWRAIGEWLISEFGVRRSEAGDGSAQVAASGGLPASGEAEERAFGAIRELVAEQVRKLCNSLENCAIEISDKVFASLLRRQLQAVRIPYEGEPLEGVQVMGFLETRALDFENVVVLSLTDDILPGSVSGGSSFIPYHLKVGYGLPTAAHHEAMYAYYFYRLLQHARKVHLVYCSRSDERRRGEPSRYIHQLDYESPHAIERREIALDAHLSGVEPIAIPKTGETLAKLNAYLDADSGKRLSPTAFFGYIVCPLRFYYRSVAAIRIDEALSEDVDARMFGTLLHRAMETLYRPLTGVDNPALEGLDVEGAIEKAIDEQQLGRSGNLQIAGDIVARYIRRGILPFDARQRGVRFESLETPLAAGVACSRGTAWFHGTADRVDLLPGGLRRVVDYKTARIGQNSLVMEFADVESLFGGEARGAAGAAMQTLLYALMLNKMHGGDVQPAIYAVRHLSEPGYSPLLVDKAASEQVWRYSDYAERFEAQVRATLEEIFDPDRPFTQCEDEKQCRYCDYSGLCGRGID